MHLSTARLGKNLIAQRAHRRCAQREKGRCTVRGEVLTNVQMDAQGVGEQRRGFVCLSEDLIGHLFLIEGISTFHEGRPREVITVGKQIFKNSSYGLQEHERQSLTRIRPGRLEIGIIVLGKAVRATEVKIEHSGSLLQGPIDCLSLDAVSLIEIEGGEKLTVRMFERHDEISFAALRTSSAGI